ncbi:MAG: hypothetical protein GX076_00180 [Clostridiales bacterium]|nr:hypothetical protein [Clostridiales bacterium]
MSIEKIVEKILSEANQEAAKVLDRAKEEKANKLEEAKKKADQLIEDAKKRGKEDSELLVSRRISVAELEARKMKLQTKQQIIQKCFDLALEKLANLKEEDYINLMVDAISQTGVSEGELILNKRDRDKVGKKIIERLNGKLTLSKENIDAKGGFVLRQGSVEINSTLERMVDSIKEEVTPEIVETLF